MKPFTNRLFTKVANLSNHTGAVTKLADGLLSRVAPQQTAIAMPCGPWERVGCCGIGYIAKNRRYCFGGGEARPWYSCFGQCYP
ncbi:MAG: hypothetical protein GFH27_549309n53 [Chloroflexi bacterium AL-W]|nr:hypothetical protein [Chloroflexi bacterium AL-N1]NOK69756.1 hypothetical protein [Chloroflexi bacterium AL-N10]NOK73640.1 hypothetical protein [Chloroflexi bacterium AL-N5]NOK83926.1 hypothetical protein [Chloroflexi bacterium AL-W]NOK87971.1 hypothetical protein [Chloroflexi bacterium AL-N15]